MSEQKKGRSTRTQLESRGFIEHFDIYPNKREKETSIVNLNDKQAIKRTIAAKHLSLFANEEEICKLLLQRLTIEKALYTRMEICKSLQNATQQVGLLIDYLAVIPNKQYTTLPKRITKKNSYPLPRDLIARTLGRMDIEVLPDLLNALVIKPRKVQREAIIAIGYLLYNNDFSDEIVFKIIEATYYNSKDPVYRWKVMIVMGQLLPYSTEFLSSIRNDGTLRYKEAQKALSKQKEISTDEL
ncbi:hypothetical protein EDD63_10788 [Breznakia blatticola]|uniref:HEAT repeat domain-containing protein n=1 Tax=Breznakia blatticola TaxID=1754012 RepID=A0A4R8A382_9FIRM|nr:hypothetical protein [Breznakia blatticola]TDW24932.1 hypothetical protein EDD63_10788 [Breznakia blatticola]